jgi:uncharacterized protein YceK
MRRTLLLAIVASLTLSGCLVRTHTRGAHRGAHGDRTSERHCHQRGGKHQKTVCHAHPHGGGHH